MRIALLSCALLGCAYKPGSFTARDSHFPGQRATIGCLDVAIERRTDFPIGPVLGYRFANRCDHPTTVDLGALAVVGRDAAGAETALHAYDPHAELHPVALEARNTGAESLAYPARQAIAQVCVDVATLAREQPARWLCFDAAVAVVGGQP
jgi:hypothetical protein